MRSLGLLLGFSWSVLAASAVQLPLIPSPEVSQEPPLVQDREDVARSSYYELPTRVKRVAVIGAGANGLLHASTLLENGFEVRLFERAPKPGGTWFYSDKTPIPASFP